MLMSICLQRMEGITRDRLRSEAKRLVKITSRQTAELIAHLSEISRRKAFLPSHSNMFMYCVRELGLGEGAANTRIQVANSCRRFPALLDSIGAHRMSLTVAARA